MKIKSYKIEGTGLEKIEASDFQAELSNPHVFYFHDIVTHDRAQAAAALKGLGISNRLEKRMSNPSRHLRFRYYGDILYGELSYYSSKTNKNYYAALILKENIMVNVFDRELGITQNLLKTLPSLTEKERENMKSEYLLYALILELLSYNGQVMLKIRERIDKLAMNLDANPNDTSPDDFLAEKSKLNNFSRMIDELFYTLSFPPARDMLNMESSYRFYFSDLSKTMGLVRASLEQVESRLNWLQDHFELLLQEKSNKRLKFLTITQAVFVPLTLIAGIYGMNFKVMPELEYAHGYFVVLGVMLATAGATIWYFYKNKWFD